MKVKATGEYMRRGIKDALLNRIPNEGEEFEVTRERFDILNGKNPYKELDQDFYDFENYRKD